MPFLSTPTYLFFLCSADFYKDLSAFCSQQFEKYQKCSQFSFWGHYHYCMDCMKYVLNKLLKWRLPATSYNIALVLIVWDTY